MNVVFADTFYWVALAKPKDPWKEPARQAKERLGQVRIITTDSVLTEFLNALAEGGPLIRDTAAQMVDEILANPNVKVVPQTRDVFRAGIDRYRSRKDKGYSLTDCISMNIMETEGIQEVLTNDHHFEQEGKVVLIKRNGNA